MLLASAVGAAEAERSLHRTYMDAWCNCKLPALSIGKEFHHSLIRKANTETPTKRSNINTEGLGLQGGVGEVGVSWLQSGPDVAALD